MKHIYAFFSIIVFVILTLIGYHLRSTIFGNTTYLALFSSLYGAVVGGMIGGLGSYYGAILGTTISIKKSEKQSRVSLFKQINYTHDLFVDYLKDKENKCDEIINLAVSESLIYDRNWVSHLNNCTDIDSLYFSLVVDWFNAIRHLEITGQINYASDVRPSLTDNDINQVCLKIGSMENLLKKYNKQKF